MIELRCGEWGYLFSAEAIVVAELHADEPSLYEGLDKLCGGEGGELFGKG
ncbi:Uncharacterised protein [Chlamydia trachomatis]|nr:Uncharacterised protein [Chlamydia trachomatis]